MAAILEVTGLEKRFGGAEVLRGVDFTVETGDVLSIIGSSGSGKTTLLRCLNFLETPDAGVIRVNGETLFDAADPRAADEKRLRKNRLRFGLVFQSFNLFPQYTALQNLTLAKSLLAQERPDWRTGRARIRDEIDAQARALLAEVGLSDKAELYPHQLSGGQQQRVAIARALALEPDILCFDEPTSSLDPELTAEVLAVIRRLAESKRTMIVVTHEMGFAREVSDQILYMHGGVIAERGTPAQIFGESTNKRLRGFIDSVL